MGSEGGVELTSEAEGALQVSVKHMEGKGPHTISLAPMPIFINFQASFDPSIFCNRGGILSALMSARR